MTAIPKHNTFETVVYELISSISDNQDAIYSFIETLNELIQRLAPLAGAIPLIGGHSLRVSQTSVPSTAVTGPQTSAEFIAVQHIAGRNYTRMVALENMAAQANIDNVTGA